MIDEEKPIKKGILEYAELVNPVCSVKQLITCRFHDANVE
jgi:hypothetical protein